MYAQATMKSKMGNFENIRDYSGRKRTRKRHSGSRPVLGYHSPRGRGAGVMGALLAEPDPLHVMKVDLITGLLGIPA